MTQKYLLIFLDLDGTLVGSTDTVSPRTVRALHQAQAQGCTLVLCTARNRLMVEEIAAQIGGSGYAILANGALICDWQTGDVIRRVPLSLGAFELGVRLAHEFQTVPFCYGVEDDGRFVYADRHHPVSGEYAARNAHRLVFCDNLATDLPRLPTSLGVYGEPGHIQFLASAWREALGAECQVFDSATLRYGGWTAWINAVEADKANAAQAVAALLAVPREQTLAIGDHLNDLSLLRWAGLGVCMGDGHADVQAQADCVTGAQADDGVAAAIERFVLSQCVLQRKPNGN